jgi:hypothetical protein
MVGGQLLPPVFAPPPLLTCRLAANGLEWLMLRWWERLVTVAAAPLAHVGRYRTASPLKALETAVKFLPPPRQWAWPPTTLPAKSRVFYSGDNKLNLTLLRPEKAE